MPIGSIKHMYFTNDMLSACTFGGGFVIVSLMKKNSEIGGKWKLYLV